LLLAALSEREGLLYWVLSGNGASVVINIMNEEKLQQVSEKIQSMEGDVP
jgi:hypothetical protein